MCSLFSGDLLFVRPTNEGLDQSIAESTNQAGQVTYSHVALVDGREDKTNPIVIEATGDDGVVFGPWSAFLQKNRGRIDVYRFNGENHRLGRCSGPRFFAGR